MEKEQIDLYRNIIEQLIPLHQWLGLRLEHIEAGYALLRLPFKPELVGDPRTSALHGGMIASVMDSAGGAAAMTTLLSFEDKLSTIDMRVDYLQPGKPQDLLIEGKIVRNGNRILVTRMTAYHSDQHDQPIAEGKGVFNVRRKTDL